MRRWLRNCPRPSILRGCDAYQMRSGDGLQAESRGASPGRPTISPMIALKMRLLSVAAPSHPLCAALHRRENLRPVLWECITRAGTQRPLIDQSLEIALPHARSRDPIPDGKRREDREQDCSRTAGGGHVGRWRPKHTGEGTRAGRSVPPSNPFTSGAHIPRRPSRTGPASHRWPETGVAIWCHVTSMTTLVRGRDGLLRRQGSLLLSITRPALGRRRRGLARSRVAEPSAALAHNHCAGRNTPRLTANIAYSIYDGRLC
jgi:hypothetical protein